LGRRRGGFTLLEMIVVVVILGITAAYAVPSWRQIQQDSQLKGAARTVANAFQFARTQAIVTERIHLVYFGMGPGADACGNPLQDPAGNPVPVLILDDGAPGSINQNCCIDAGETIVTERAVAGVFWGTSFAGAAVPDDSGLGNFATGSSLADALGVQTQWVAFRPDGVPVGVTAACVLGQTGSGRGGIYLTNAPPFQNRDYAVLLSPLGGTKIYAWDRVAGNWTN
jgi:prepilin-type N-terminal cleavage/methylation domain-containing protein